MRVATAARPTAPSVRRPALVVRAAAAPEAPSAGEAKQNLKVSMVRCAGWERLHARTCGGACK